MGVTEVATATVRVDRLVPIKCGTTLNGILPGLAARDIAALLGRNNLGRQEEVVAHKQIDFIRAHTGKVIDLLGGNHRYNLSTAVMLKDNHIDAAGGVARAIEMARAHASFTTTVEIECENLDMVHEAVEAGADIIMFDNMTHDDMAAAIELIDGRAKTECSGNVDAGNIRALADLGVDFISSGALTHSAPILDLSLKHLRLLDGK